MADLDDILKRASNRPAIPSVKMSTRDFGLKRTMDSIREKGAETQIGFSQQLTVDNNSNSNMHVLVETPSPASTPLLNNLKVDKVEAEKGSNDNTDIFNPKALIISAKSTDTMPTQNLPEYRYSTDTNAGLTDLNEYKSSSNTDTVPTQNIASKSNLTLNEAPLVGSTDTVQIRAPETLALDAPKNLEIENIGTKPILSKGAETKPKSTFEKVRSKSTDTIPTQTDISEKTLDTNINTNTEPTQYRHNTDTINTKKRHRADTEPTQTRQSTDTIPTPNPTQIFGQNGPSTDTDFIFGNDVEVKFRLLRGLKLKLADHCTRECIRNNSNKLRTTYESLALTTEIPLGSIRTTAKRLRDEGLIKIYAPLKGPGAFVDIVLPDSIIRVATRFLLEIKHSADTVPTQNSPEYRHNTDTQSDTNGSSSSSNNLIYKNTTTSWESISHLWIEVDLNPLLHIGFSQNHIRQIAMQGALTPEQVQDSIRYFAFDLSENGKAKRIKGPELNFFMGILRRGSPYTPPDNYVSEKENALKAILERKKAESERVRQLKEEILDFDFEAWASKLSASEKLQKVPESNFAKIGSAPYRAMLKQYFSENEWSGATES